MKNNDQIRYFLTKKKNRVRHRRKKKQMQNAKCRIKVQQRSPKNF